MQLTDRADDLLGILYANPDKISRTFLKEKDISESLFDFDESLQSLFKIIVIASYAGKKLNETLIDSYAAKLGLNDDKKADLDIAFLRVKEAESDFSLFEDSLFLFLQELKIHRFRRMLLDANERMNKGDKIEDILLSHKEGMDRLLAESSVTTTVSSRNFVTRFIKFYEQDISDQAISYCIKQMDDAVGNILPGELHIIAGASGEGKSIVLLNIIYNNIIQGKNFALSSLEMSKEQCFMRLLSIHSTHPKFGYNLDHERIKRKQLTEEEKDQLYEVTKDFCENPEYGELFFIENTGAVTVEDIFTEVEDISRYTKVHAVAIDYISLLAGQGSSERAVISNNFKLIKNKALTFNKGQKIPVISVHQISEQAKEKAEESGKYDFNFLSDTSESKKSSDVGFWILRTAQHKANKEIAAGVWKSRDSKGDSLFSMFEQFEFCKIASIDDELE